MGKAYSRLFGSPQPSELDWRTNRRETPTPIIGRDNTRVFPSSTRRVEIGLNVIAIQDIADAHHYFQCNMLLHVWWNAVPLELKPEDKNPQPFIPWIQLHNLRSMIHDVTENKGLIQPTKEELQRRLKDHLDAGKKDEPLIAFSQNNFVAQFLNHLHLHAFPFDAQQVGVSFMIELCA
jgi:hypothetical protein